MRPSNYGGLVFDSHLEARIASAVMHECGMTDFGEKLHPPILEPSISRFEFLTSLIFRPDQNKLKHTMTDPYLALVATHTLMIVVPRNDLYPQPMRAARLFTRMGYLARATKKYRDSLHTNRAEQPEVI
jgi:hypothetical protein